MATVARPFQVVVWGASGFVGQLVCERLATEYPVRSFTPTDYSREAHGGVVESTARGVSGSRSGEARSRSRKNDQMGCLLQSGPTLVSNFKGVRSRSEKLGYRIDDSECG